MLTIHEITLRVAKFNKSVDIKSNPFFLGRGASRGGRADPNGEHLNREPVDEGEVLGLGGQVRSPGQAALGRRRGVQELLPGRPREKRGQLHQRLPQERVPQKVHGQVHQVVVETYFGHSDV